jgi:hypothetical protein
VEMEATRYREYENPTRHLDLVRARASCHRVRRAMHRVRLHGSNRRR